MIYPIFLGEEQIGTAKVQQQGMYALIRCVCSNGESLKQSIFLGDVPLGKCVPEGEEYTLFRRIPRKKLPEIMEFRLRGENGDTNILLRETAPVENLEMLCGAKLCRRGEEIFMVIRDQISNSSKTGQ